MKKLLFFVVTSTLLMVVLHAQTHTPLSVKKNVMSERYDIIMKDRKPAGLFDKISNTKLNLAGEEVTTNKNVKRAKLSVVTKPSTREDLATITLTVVGDPWGNGTGVQLLLDQDAEIVDHFWDWFWEDDEQFYINSEYKIPENADLNFNDLHVINDGTGSVDIPEGIYDFIFFRPWDMLEMIFILNWAGTEDMAVGDDFEFLAGFEYIFTVETAGEVTLETPADITLSKIILPPPSLDLTNEEQISVVLYNNGAEDITGEVELSYKINDGGEIIVENFDISELAPGAEITYTFTAKADFSGVGFYTVEAHVEYEFDANPYNNTITGQTKKMAIIELPFVDEFDTPASMLKWLTIDGNGDGLAWVYDNIFLTDADGGKGCLQVLCQSYGADEYLITDPIAIPVNGSYEMSFYATRLGNDQITVLYGTTPNVKEMDVLEVVTPNDSDWEKIVLNFGLDTSGNYFFAFHYLGDKSTGAGGINFDKFNFIHCWGINDVVLNKEHLKLYPNPANNVLNVALKNADMNIDKVIVSNILGKQVLLTSNINSSIFQLNTAGFAPGLYFITVQTPAGVIHSKFIVE